jgi:thymidylate synthase (FAD)
MDAHAQYEIRAYADAMFDIARRVAPAACEAFTDYVVESVRFSGAEVEALRSALGLAERESAGGSAAPPRLAEAAEAAGITGKALSRLLGKLSRE